MLTPQERAEIELLHAQGLPAQQIGHRINRDRRTVSLYLKRRGLLEERRDPKPELPPILPNPPVEHSDARVTAARDRLWAVLMDENSPGQAVVQAFNALAESEGWATAPPKPLPEPTDDEDIIERFVVLFGSFSGPIQARVLERLSAPS